MLKGMSNAINQQEFLRLFTEPTTHPCAPLWCSEIVDGVKGHEAGQESPPAAGSLPLEFRDRWGDDRVEIFERVHGGPLPGRVRGSYCADQ